MSMLKQDESPSAFVSSTFADFTPYERQLLIAEIYHNIWYSQERFEKIYDMINEWKGNPIKETKFLAEIKLQDL